MKRKTCKTIYISIEDIELSYTHGVSGKMEV
jgi:hypothetical protein